MLRENIDNVLNPPVVRHCCVLSICILKPMPMHFSFACSANIEHRVGFLRREPRCSITTHSHVHDLYSLFASCCHIQLHNYESIVMLTIQHGQYQCACALIQAHSPLQRTVEDQTEVLLNEMKMMKEIINDTTAANQVRLHKVHISGLVCMPELPPDLHSQMQSYIHNVHSVPSLFKLGCLDAQVSAFCSLVRLCPDLTFHDALQTFVQKKKAVDPVICK